MRALVTGGGRGIGAGIARALAGDGWDVVVGARSREQVEAVADEIGGAWVQVDVTDCRWVERAVAQAGEVDLLVANAGVADNREQRPSWEIDPAEWWRIYEVNVLGVHLCWRAVIPGMLERGSGRIAITASAAAYLPGGRAHRLPAQQSRGLPLRRVARQRARRPLPARRARRPRRAARADRRDARARPERHQAQALISERSHAEAASRCSLD
jgi:NAD(P)-dependent dehydrogenase (short-subunit alcohol dehydrogenase family)